MLFEDRSRAWRCGKGLLIVVAMGLLVSACGRRGPLEAPPSAAAQPRTTTTSTGNGQPASGTARLATNPAAATLDTPEDESDQQDPVQNVVPNPTPTAPGGRKRGRAYEVPKQPFILDPLL